MEPKMRSAPFRGIQVAFSDSGKGRVLVLLHGFLGAKGIWAETIQNLSRSYRIIAIDLPGHGDTPCIGYAHSMEMMANCVKAVMNHLKLKRYVIVGHSMGGYVALAFADLFPDQLKGLGLYHSTAYADSEERRENRLRAIEVVKANRKLYTHQTIRSLFASKNLKYLKEEIKFANGFASKMNKQGIIAALHGMRDRKGRDLILGLVEYPILMVIGEHDNVLPFAQLLEQAEAIKNKQVLFLEHDGHFGFLESPRESHKAIRKFLRACYG
jgi:pimeloyl-ACP methyl ester carboxylesterase